MVIQILQYNNYISFDVNSLIIAFWVILLVKIYIHRNEVKKILIT